ncbi:hypothetical protein JCM10212_005619 [Sporobolomyces blumeae]
MVMDSRAELPKSTSATPTRRRAPVIPDDGGKDENEDDDEGLGVIEEQLVALEAKRARLRTKREKTDDVDIKPKVSPGPPFDWRGNPPIDFGKRIYVDFVDQEASQEELKVVEREKADKERRNRNAIVLE